MAFNYRRANTIDPFTYGAWEPFLSDEVSHRSRTERPRFPFPTETAICIDWKETSRAHVFKADVPGMKKEEVTVEVEDGGVLQISGEKIKEQEERGDTWHRIERGRGKFLRRFRLPENVKVEEVKASMENGVLTVTVPKPEPKKPDVRSIEISG